MSDFNKLLWLLFILGLTTIISLGIKVIQSKKVLAFMGVLSVITLTYVSVNWVLGIGIR